MSDAKDKNEDLFREVNERIEAISATVPVAEPTMDFLCECDDAECQEKVRATRAEYEAVRAESTHFIVLANHVDPSVEHVIASNERFLVVEKEGAAARRAEESDPREQS
jgi:alpha-D-ribose 1-methylphosphonate 5-triphosphate diphosphatase PhnM